MLKVEDLNVYYGGIHALQGLSFEIKEGEIITLIGSNGAGKTSTLRAISNLIKSKGSIKYKDEEINDLSAEKIVAKRLIHVPEGRRIFTALTVEENLLMGAYLRKDKEKIKEDLEFVYKLFPRLKERTKQYGGTLSGGEQQMLAIGRALLSDPELLMLDEPSMGLAPIVIEEIFESIKEINKKTGLTFLFVEQNANIALQTADRGYVIETGKILFSGDAKDLLHDDRVRKAYLGEE
ncbi:ABC transporter ATP-binding protein [Tissierella carlieri]|jgi:branched-chain amino acid transport system ATP-binding protein|uniref:ABC transporter ATP-binding protein n=1 Tax=Tissierella carlieri TaxID=689904 RepID=A0ABT1SH74_9FIRM|nr:MULTISPECIES: ABC transporter ATP-binding protein [Tissierella]MBU5312735.1 ABC transporter ATP-binding protein [Tissierella carlieri]MCQ4925838.1 ABC transporter ATP-binding protein [Tissierella carlieri]OZV10242.1 ABC transporter ATP-binding protein [Tissierella sp. P1]